jgi:hypothetical protein
MTLELQEENPNRQNRESQESQEVELQEENPNRESQETCKIRRKKQFKLLPHALIQFTAYLIEFKEKKNKYIKDVLNSKIERTRKKTNSIFSRVEM